MKLNNKGFAISVVLYAMVILIIGVLYLLIDIVNTRYILSKKTKEEVVEYINNQGVNTLNSSLNEKIATNFVINTGNMSNYNGNYYYSGSNPTNYVTFNDESWRIIGVFNIDGVKYLKLIKTHYLQQMATNNKQMIDSNVFSYLNNDYYNSIGPDRILIKKINWTNPQYNPNVRVNIAYSYERTASLMSNNYVGLINSSDFAYTANSSYHDKNLSEYQTSSSNHWLAFAENYFTMSYYSSNINVITSGSLINSSNFSAYVYPCIYLKKDVLITGGTGEVNNHYKLSLN